MHKTRTAPTVLFTIVLFTAAAKAGMYYTVRQTYEFPPEAMEQMETHKSMGFDPTAPVKFAVSRDGDNMRIDYITRMMVIPEGTFLISRNGGKTIYLCDPMKKTYSEIDTDKLQEISQGAVSDMMSFTYSDPRAELEANLGTETIAGYKCTKDRLKVAYTTVMKMGFMKNRTRNETVYTVWSTDKFDYGRFSTGNLGTFTIGDDGVDTVIESEIGGALGFPMKIKSVSTVDEKEGGKMTMTVEEIEKKDIPGETFRIPENYTEAEYSPVGLSAKSKDVHKGHSFHGFMKRSEEKKNE